MKGASWTLYWLLGLLMMMSDMCLARVPAQEQLKLPLHGSDQEIVKLPVRTLLGLDGKKHTLSGMANGKPVLLVFLQEDPALKRGVRDMNRLAKQLKGKIQVVGVHPDLLGETRKLVRRFGIRFPVLCNPEWAGPPASNWLALIGDRYGCNILITALVLPNGRVLSKFGGYSQWSLQEMFRKLREAGGAKVGISLKSYPKNVVEGHSVIFGLTPP